MAIPIYGVNANAAEYGCCADLEEAMSYVAKNTEILLQLMDSKKKEVATERINLLITDVEARIKYTVIPIKSNVRATSRNIPVARAMRIEP
jgi:hypothetical protein